MDGPHKIQLDGTQKCVGGQKGGKVDGPHKIKLDGPKIRWRSKKVKVDGLEMHGRSKRDGSGRFNRMLLQVGPFRVTITCKLGLG